MINLKQEKIEEDAKDMIDEMAKEHASTMYPYGCTCFIDKPCDWCLAKDAYLEGDVGC